MFTLCLSSFPAGPEQLRSWAPGSCPVWIHCREMSVLPAYHWDGRETQGPRQGKQLLFWHPAMLAGAALWHIKLEMSRNWPRWESCSIAASLLMIRFQDWKHNLGFVSLLKGKPERHKHTASAATPRSNGTTEDKTQGGSKGSGDVVLKDSVVSLAQEQLQQILNTVETNRNGPKEEKGEHKGSQGRSQRCCLIWSSLKLLHLFIYYSFQ